MPGNCFLIVREYLIMKFTDFAGEMFGEKKKRYYTRTANQRNSRCILASI